MRMHTQDELIARALDTEEGNILERHNYLHLEEKRARVRVVRQSITGPVLRWISKKEHVKVPVPVQPAECMGHSIPLCIRRVGLWISCHRVLSMHVLIIQHLRLHSQLFSSLAIKVVDSSPPTPRTCFNMHSQMYSSLVALFSLSLHQVIIAVPRLSLVALRSNRKSYKSCSPIRYASLATCLIVSYLVHAFLSHIAIPLLFAVVGAVYFQK